MRPIQVTVTSGNSPYTIPVDGSSEVEGGITASPSGGGNYTVDYTLDNLLDPTVTPVYVNVEDMVSATTDVGKAFGTGVRGFRVTLNSGTDVTVSISQPSK